jgi:hypothetical protein
MSNNVTRRNRKNGNGNSASYANGNVAKGNNNNNNNNNNSNNNSSNNSNNNATQGGKRKHKGSRKHKTAKRKLSQGAQTWLGHVKRILKELKAKNPNASLKDAMKEASHRKKKGQL